MAVEITNAEKIRRLPWNIAFNAGNNVFVQLTYFGSAFVLFLSALSLSNTQIGFMMSLLPFFGILALFAAPFVARYGYKRTYLITFNIRNIITIGLLLVPTVMTEMGADAAITLVTLVIMGFAFFRAIGDTALIPWIQEYIPNSIRGKHSAMNDMVSRITSIVAVGGAGYVLGLSDGLERFMLLFAIGIVFEFFAAYSVSHLPGGLPAQTGKTSYSDLLHAVRDRNFMLYLVGLGLVIVASAPLSFLPLFMQDQVGLNDSAVVWLQIGTIVGGFSATYLLGWASDRYGSKPVMLTGLYVKALLPVGWLLMPRNSDLSLLVGLIIALIWGIAEIAWAIGSGRLLYVKVVPVERKTEYMAVFYAFAGIIGGFSQIASGSVLDMFSGISGTFLIFPLDSFTPLFIAGIVLNFAAIILFSRVQADSPVSVGEFAGMFLHGNPVLALQSLVRYYRSTDERATVVTTERMGQTKSLLTVDELLEALKDPRFNVRFEAIISIARMGREPRLVDALCRILDGTEISLSVISAWALGRMGDESALPTLRAGFNSTYRSIQAHCVRSLGTLGDIDSAPLIFARLEMETDKGLRIACASALGNLRYEPSLNLLMNILETTENEGARMELALAVARIVDGEQHFIRLLRNIRNDAGTTVSQALSAWRRKTDKTAPPELKTQIEECANLFARNQIDEGALLLAEVYTALPLHDRTTVSARVLDECAAMLKAHQGTRLEYLVLALCVLHSEDISGR